MLSESPGMFGTGRVPEVLANFARRATLTLACLGSRRNAALGANNADFNEVCAARQALAPHAPLPYASAHVKACARGSADTWPSGSAVPPSEPSLRAKRAALVDGVVSAAAGGNRVAYTVVAHACASSGCRTGAVAYSTERSSRGWPSPITTRAFLPGTPALWTGLPSGSERSAARSVPGRRSATAPAKSR